ncbi:MAG: DUF4410 domain-containing protein [Nitrospiraceae bacterium]
MNHRRSAYPARFVVALGVLVSLIIGCAPTSARSVSIYSRTEPLPRPDRILVHDFAVVPDDVSPHSSFVYKLYHNQLKGTSETEEQVRVGRAVANVLSEKLVKEIRSLGLPAERAYDVQPLAKGTFSLEGQFVSIDEGTRAQRISIGFGVGDTKVRTLVQGYLGTADGRDLVEEFETNTERSKKPGVGVTVGAASSVVTEGAGGGGVTELKNAAEADARRTTVALAKSLAEFFAVQGWIAQDLVE